MQIRHITTDIYNRYLLFSVFVAESADFGANVSDKLWRGRRQKNVSYVAVMEFGPYKLQSEAIPSKKDDVLKTVQWQLYKHHIIF